MSLYIRDIRNVDPHTFTQILETMFHSIASYWVQKQDRLSIEKISSVLSDIHFKNVQDLFADEQNRA